MKRLKLIATAAVLAVLAVLASSVAAQETNTSERTFLTFSGTVEMPKLTLPAGTYVFKLADTPSRNVVQVWDREEKEMLGQWLFVQSERNEVTGDNVVMFKETAAGSTPAIQYWYFPGEKIGKEFVYPKDQATQIAARTGGNVLTEEGGAVSSVDAKGNISQWEKDNKQAAAPPADSQGVVQGDSVSASAQANAPAAQPEPQPQPELRADASASQQAPSDRQDPATHGGAAVGTSGQADNDQAARELPRTASPLLLSGLISLLSLSGALGVRALRG